MTGLWANPAWLLVAFLLGMIVMGFLGAGKNR